MAFKKGNTISTKYKELVDYYRNYQGEKTKYSTFKQRVITYGIPREEAIINNHRRRYNYISKVDENGRECTKCGVYKEWDEFHISRHAKTTNNRSTQCKECRNKYKKEYRVKTGYAKDREYKHKKRHLEIGQQVLFNGEVREIIEKPRFGYMVKSLFSGETRKRNTSDIPPNCKGYTNSVKSFKVLDVPIKLIEKKEETVEEKKTNYKISMDEMFDDDYYY